MAIVNGVDTSKVYTADEVYRMYQNGQLRDVAVAGYVSRADADGTCRFVHWTQANRMTGDPDHRPGVYTADFDMRAALEEGLPEITKRTPQQRVASLMLKILAGASAQGGKLGLTDSQIAAIVGESWKAGTPLAAEDVRRVAQHFLQEAERDTERQERAMSARQLRKHKREQERLAALERKAWERLRENAAM